MKALPVALLSSIILVGCAGPSQLLFASPIVVDHLDGNYQRLAACTYDRLGAAVTTAGEQFERPAALLLGVGIWARA
jgi:hypothetical protein